MAENEFIDAIKRNFRYRMFVLVLSQAPKYKQYNAIEMGVAWEMFLKELDRSVKSHLCVYVLAHMRQVYLLVGDNFDSVFD
jgi:hypothetical protein